MNEIPYNIAQEFTRNKDKYFSCPEKFKRKILLAEEFFELDIILIFQEISMATGEGAGVFKNLKIL